MMDQDTQLTICYVMNKMESGLEGDMRGANIVLAAAVAVAGAGAGTTGPPAAKAED
jgi:hypothetical protein